VPRFSRLSYLGAVFRFLFIRPGPRTRHAAEHEANARDGRCKKQTTASATGTITAINAADRKITFNHGPIPEIKWPAMKMEFPVAPSVDLSKAKVGDKVRFTLSGSGNAYTVQSISLAP
jgi:Cu/Ag efflux protein CusF